MAKNVFKFGHFVATDLATCKNFVKNHEKVAIFVKVAKYLATENRFGHFVATIKPQVAPEKWGKVAKS